MLMIIFICTLTWMVLFDNQSSVSFVSANASMPDAIMEGATTLILNKQGKPKMKLSAVKMIHFTKNDNTQFVLPQLTFYRDKSPWYVNSHYASATQGIEHVQFWQNVIIHYPADEEQPDTIIKTRQLSVHPQQQIAETDEKITLTQPNLKLQSKGMHANMQTGFIKLLSNARGEYVPH